MCIQIIIKQPFINDSLFSLVFLIITVYYWKKKHNMGAVLLYWNSLHRSNRQWLGGRIVPYLYILLMHCNRWNPMGREMLHWCTIKSDAKSWAISIFLTSSVKEIFSARMSLSPTSPTSATTTAASAVLTNINRMEGHLLTRFHHIDPDLVDEYLSGRRRQVGLIDLDNLFHLLLMDF